MRFAYGDQTLGQHFEFGDLRIKVEHVTVVVEAESAGGITNLVKYWPLLAAGTLAKGFIPAHLFLIISLSDFIAHRRLWKSLLDRLRKHLERPGVLMERIHLPSVSFSTVDPGKIRTCDIPWTSASVRFWRFAPPGFASQPYTPIAPRRRDSAQGGAKAESAQNR